MDLWKQLTSSTPGLLSKRSREGTLTAGSGGKVLEPVDDFVAMEHELAGELCGTVDISLGALKKVLFGSGLLTPAIQAVAASLLSGAVPVDWTRRWDRGPEKPQAWLRELVRKRISLTKWKSSSAKGSLLSEPLGLGDLFNPATFINALRQQTARQVNTAIDRVKMISMWSKDSKELKSICPLPCTLVNLLLQGASFNGGNMQEPSPDASEIIPAPQVHIGFVPIDGKYESRDNSLVAVPVYLNPSREDFLMELQVPAKGDQQKWVLSGVALFLSEDD